MSPNHYVSIIKEGFSHKRKHNPLYSLQAYARDLGLRLTTVKQILKGKRVLRVEDSQSVANRLNLAPQERTLFLESLYQTQIQLDQIKTIPNDKRFILNESYYKVIAEWEHYALLMLFDIAGFTPTISEIAKRLGISKSRAETVFNNLLVSGLLERDFAGKIKRVHGQIRTTEDVSSQALKDSHKEAMNIGKQKLEQIDVNFRDFSSITVAMDMKKLVQAKTIIREFRQKMAALLEDGEKTAVYQLAIQFYPLTKMDDAEIQTDEIKENL